MKRIILCGKRVSIPESWIELSTGMWVQLMNIADGTTELALISAFTGLSEEVLSKSKDINIDRKVFGIVGWYSVPIDFKALKRKTKVTVAGKEVKIPKDLGFKTLGQKILLQQRMKTTKGSLSSLIPYAFAVYTAPEVLGDEYDLSNVDEFVESEINKIPIIDVFPIASFFLRKSIDSMNLRVLSYTEQLTQISSGQG